MTHRYVVSATEGTNGSEYRDRARECRESSSMLALQAQLPVSERLQSTREWGEQGQSSSTQSRQWPILLPKTNFKPEEGGIAPSLVCQHPLERDQRVFHRDRAKESAEKLLALRKRSRFQRRRMVFCGTDLSASSRMIRIAIPRFSGVRIWQWRSRGPSREIHWNDYGALREIDWRRGVVYR